MQQIIASRQAGVAVRAARRSQGLTQEQLARKSGVSTRLVSSLELGDSAGIQLDKLLDILGALGLSLFIGSEAPAPREEPSMSAAQHSSPEPNPPADYRSPTADEADGDKTGNRFGISIEYDASRYYREFASRYGTNPSGTPEEETHG